MGLAQDIQKKNWRFRKMVSRRSGTQLEVLQGDEPDGEAVTAHSEDKWRKLEIPIFDGGDLHMVACRFFSNKGSHGGGDEETSYGGFRWVCSKLVPMMGESCNPNPTWDMFKEAIVGRFQPTSIQDPL